MTKFTLIGVLACVGGGVLIAFQAISSAMGIKGEWQNVSLVDIVGPSYFEWMENASLGGAERVAEYVAAMPLFVILFCIGGLFFILSYFFGRR